MKKLAILSPLVLLATTALAQDSTCILQPSCSQLGYTSAEADCGTAKVLRCPFDVSQVACLSSGSDGGSGGETGGEPSDEFGTVDNSSCQVGYIYYSDDTCSPEYNYFKDPIGIVFDANRRYIVGFKERNYIEWSTKSRTSANIPYITDILAQQRDLNGATYTKTIEDLNTPTYYPAAQFCFEDVTGDKEWFLPSAGQMYLLAKNYNLINNAFLALRTASLNVIFPTLLVLRNEEYTRYYWTSNLYDASDAVYLTLDLSFSHEYLKATVATGVYYETAVRCIAEY